MAWQAAGAPETGTWGRHDGGAAASLSPCCAIYSSSAATAAVAVAAAAAMAVPLAADSTGETPPMEASPVDACVGGAAVPPVAGAAWLSVKVGFWETVVPLRRFVALVPFS